MNRVDYARRRFYEALLFHDLTGHSGDAFQDLISKYLTAAYEGDFQRISAVGRRGDGGCDGYRRSSKTVYQCYGKERGSAVSVPYITNKIKTDFAQALETFKNGRMREWVFVHNLVDGLPNEANLAIELLQEQNPTIAIRTMSKDALQALLFALPDQKLDDIFPPSEKRSFSDIDPSDVRRLLKAIASSARTPIPEEIKPVPMEKIAFNQLSEASARIIRDNFQYSAQVGKFVTDEDDAMFGDKVANVLKEKYRALKAQGLRPDDIMDNLLGFVLGSDRIGFGPDELKAAEAILAYFFNNCDVFEDTPQASQANVTSE